MIKKVYIREEPPLKDIIDEALEIEGWDLYNEGAGNGRTEGEGRGWGWSGAGEGSGRKEYGVKGLVI